MRFAAYFGAVRIDRLDAANHHQQQRQLHKIHAVRRRTYAAQQGVAAGQLGACSAMTCPVQIEQSTLFRRHYARSILFVLYVNAVRDNDNADIAAKISLKRFPPSHHDACQDDVVATFASIDQVVL